MSFLEQLKDAYEDGKQRGAELGSFEFLAQEQKEKCMDKQTRKTEHRDRIKEMKREGTAYCPKCKGTSIQYIERRKRLSVTRGILGAALISPVAGAVGALTSKKYKGFVKCMNCGHRWKT